MIAVDSNILVYAHRQDSEWHVRSRDRIAELAEGRSAWAIPWPCIHEFLGVVTHPRVFVPPTPLAKAIDQVEAWFESPSLVLLAETDSHWHDLKQALTSGRVIGSMVHDARLAALCAAHGVRELWTADRDFSRFRGLRVGNPLVD